MNLPLKRLRNLAVAAALSLVAISAHAAEKQEIVISPYSAWLGPKQTGEIEVKVWLTLDRPNGAVHRVKSLRTLESFAKVSDDAEVTVDKEYPFTETELAPALANLQGAAIELEFTKKGRKIFGQSIGGKKLGSAIVRLSDLEYSSRKNPLRWAWNDGDARIEGIAFGQVTGIIAKPVVPPDPSCFPKTLFISRHAEKQGPENAGLTEAGKKRAQQLQELFQNVEFEVLLATTLPRTQETIAPTRDALFASAERSNREKPVYVEIQDHDTEATVDLLTRVYCDKVVLVVTHSGTIPSLMQGLEAEGDYGTEYGDLMLVQRRAGRTTSIVLRVGEKHKYSYPAGNEWTPFKPATPDEPEDKSPGKQPW